MINDLIKWIEEQLSVQINPRYREEDNYFDGYDDALNDVLKEIKKLNE